MKFFKYLIFIITSFISINVFADYTINSLGFSGLYSTKEAACNAFSAHVKSYYNNNNLNYSPSIQGNTCYAGNAAYADFSESEAKCPTTVTSTPISVPGWTSWDIDQIDSYSAQIQGKTACYQGCKYKNPTMSGSEGSDMMNLVYGDGVKDSSCPTGDTTRPSTPTPNNTGSTQMKPEECKSPTGSDGYCNKPSNKQCPSGYKQGSFNNQQICIKPSPDPDPTKPNPNDPNNGDGKGNCNGTNNCNTTNFDDSKIISAINASTSAITQAISSLSNSLSSGFSSVVNAVSSVTSAVNANTSAVNSNGDKVTSAVNENTSAVNSVKSAVNGLNSSIQAVTTAVNASADKVTNAVNSNGKNTVDAVNANGEKVTNAVNENGKNTVDAVNAGTEVTKENGKKLDGIKDGIEKSNGLLEDIKNWLNGDLPPSEDGKVGVGQIELPSDNTNIIKFNAVCPAPVEQNVSIIGYSWTFSFSFDSYCEVLAKLANYFVFVAYLGAAFIVAGVRDA